MRLPPPVIAAVGSLAVVLAAAIPLAVSGPSPVQAQAPAVQVVDVSMDEWSINPRHIVVKANQPVRFVIAGTGALEHRFRVVGMGIGMDDVRSDRVLPGSTTTLDAVFTTPGTYQTYCSVDGGTHKDAGSVGTLTVVPETADAVLDVPVQNGDFFFAPMSVTAVAGQTTRFKLENVGAVSSHVLVVAGHGIVMRSPSVRLGPPVTWDVTFDAPGTYEIYCDRDVEGVLHRDLGMLGTIEVFRGGEGM